MPSTHQPIVNTGRTEIRVKGKAVFVPSVQIDGRTVIRTGKWLKVAAVHDEDLVEPETVPHPSSFIDYLKASRLNADIFTFAQKLPDVSPRYEYNMDWDNVAVIPITSFPEWWEKRVESSVRRAVRKATKEGVTVSVGSSPVWELFRMFYQMTKKPFIAGGLMLAAGYVWSLIQRVERLVSGEMVEFCRHEQMQRLKAFMAARTLRGVRE